MFCPTGNTRYSNIAHKEVDEVLMYVFILPAEKKAAEMKALVDRSPTRLLRNSNIAEYNFWQRLIDECLEPDSKAFGIEAELKGTVSILHILTRCVTGVSRLWLVYCRVTLSTEDPPTINHSLAESGIFYQSCRRVVIVSI